MSDNKKFLTLDGLQAYHKKIMEYIDSRFGDLSTAEATVDLDTGKITYIFPKEEEKEDKYYYPIPYSLFEEEDKDE